MVNRLVNRGTGTKGTRAGIASAARPVVKAPARYYLVGSEMWYLRLSRILPPSAIESLMTRRFQLSK
jgi:hypothetical protein